MAMFATDTGLMRQRSAAVLSTAERVRAEVDSMRASLSELQGTWSGSASANFQNIVAQWRATQAQVEESLSQISVALTRASEQYDQVEQANMSLFAQ